MKALLLILILSSTQAFAGWYQSSDGNFYYTAGDTNLRTIEYMKKYPKHKAKSPQAWQKGLEAYLVSKTKKEVLSNPPEGLKDGKKVSYIPGKGFVIATPKIAGNNRGMIRFSNVSPNYGREI